MSENLEQKQCISKCEFVDFELDANFIQIVKDFSRFYSKENISPTVEQMSSSTLHQFLFWQHIVLQFCEHEDGDPYFKFKFYHTFLSEFCRDGQRYKALSSEGRNVIDSLYESDSKCFMHILDCLECSQAVYQHPDEKCDFVGLKVGSKPQIDAYLRWYEEDALRWSPDAEKDQQVVKEIEIATLTFVEYCDTATPEEFKFFHEFLSAFCKNNYRYGELSKQGKDYIDALYELSENECIGKVLHCLECY